MNTKNNILAIVLIGLVILLTPIYFNLVSPAPEPAAPSGDVDNSPLNEAVGDAAELAGDPVEVRHDNPVDVEREAGLHAVFSDMAAEEFFLTIETDLYTATISNRAGGSLVHYELKNYSNSYDDDGLYVENIPVSLVRDDDQSCKPCLSYFDNDEGSGQLYNEAFDSEYLAGQTFRLSGDEQLELTFTLRGSSGEQIMKTIRFSGDSYETHHDFVLKGFEETYRRNLELVWSGGLLPTEKIERADSQNSAAIIYQSGELDNIKLSKAETVDRKKFPGNTDWVAIKSKYFIVAMLPSVKGIYGALSATNDQFGARELTPAYTASIGYDRATTHVDAAIYLGPQDYKLLQASGDALEDAMNWGFAIIRPISKYIILTALTFLHRPFGLFTINYGIVLILFAFLVRFVTGPLTRRSYRSTKKMQVIQPKVKALQAKYKKDPQRMNQEVMKLYKEEGVNPVGGCLPMVIQMPLLFALFVVFRNTIEFRGAGFFLWITDLSQPDVVFQLPFSIPIYGAGVAILPIVMGVTMFFQQRLSMATMDKNQRPMMYMMTGFFFLLFNSFPSGLNLYYAVYNILNILQQRSIKADV